MVTISGSLLTFGGVVLTVVFFGVSVWLSISSARRLKEIRDEASSIRQSINLLNEFSDQIIGRLFAHAEHAAGSVQDVVKILSAKYESETLNEQRELIADTTNATLYRTQESINEAIAKQWAGFKDTPKMFSDFGSESDTE